MSDQIYTVEFVETSSGKSPFEEFLDDLDDEVQAEILATITDFIDKKNNNHRVKESLSKKIKDDIFELRTTFADGIARTLFFYLKGKRVIITHGFIKKTQKTPKQEIARAIKLRNDYLKREAK